MTQPATIAELGLSVRAYNTLRRQHIDTVIDLTATRVNEVEGFPNCGKTTVKEIKRQLARFGLTLAPRPCPHCGAPMKDR